MTRVLALALALSSSLAAASDSASASINVTATVASWAAVEVEADCARLASNDPEALAWLDAVPLVPNDPWVCPLVMYAEAK